MNKIRRIYLCKYNKKKNKFENIDSDKFIFKNGEKVIIIREKDFKDLLTEYYNSIEYSAKDFPDDFPTELRITYFDGKKITYLFDNTMLISYDRQILQFKYIALDKFLNNLLKENS